MDALNIGPYRLSGRAFLAPMAGITDLPFRRLCRRMGAALAAGEMLSADPRLWDTRGSRRWRDHSGEPEPRVVQIAGGDPEMMAEAARRNVDAAEALLEALASGLTFESVPQSAPALVLISAPATRLVVGTLPALDITIERSVVLDDPVDLTAEFRIVVPERTARFGDGVQR